MPVGDDDGARDPRPTRRGLLRLAAAATAGGAAVSLGARPALAADVPVIVGANDAGAVRTSLTSSNLNGAFEAVSTNPGDTTRPAAVMGRAQGVGIGVQGIATDSQGFGLVGLGGAAQLRLEPWPSGPSATGLHSVGAVAYDLSTNAFWVCVVEGSPGVWRKLADATTAGAFHPLATTRVYDSRLNMAPAAGGVLVSGSSRVIPCRDGRDPATGAVNASNVVPQGATAVAYNLTVTATSGRGFVSLEPGDATVSGGSTINWSASGQVIANASVAKLDANRQLKAFCSGTGSGVGCQLVVDIVGYYR